jgi:hypothetical protein
MSLEKTVPGIMKEDEELLSGVPEIWEIIKYHDETSSLEKTHFELFSKPLDEEHLDYFLDQYNSYRRFYKTLYESEDKIEKLSKCRAIINTQGLMYRELIEKSEIAAGLEEH